MSRLSIFIVLFNVFICMASANKTHYTVNYIYDGDTILLYNNIKIRYIGIDAPEIGHENDVHEYMALQSRDMNTNLVHNRDIYLEFDKEKRDRYGRLLAYVFCPDGEMINTVLLKHGLAWIMVVPPNLGHFPAFLKAQRHAISKKLGLWQRHIENNETGYTGNKQSYRFHRPDCSFGISISPQNLIRFNTVRDAFWDGFSPCRECLSENKLFPSH